ncbi:hypothetical protein [Streptomyces sp. NPDC090021]|uniref:hypothetical protein n=1 Tax=Streptomyces sp. NPDC090021 TaxID=3365919 RepID=UPI0038030AFC
MERRLRQYEGFRRTMIAMTTVRGVVYPAEAAVRIALAFVVDTDTMVVVSPVMIYTVLGCLGVWTARYGTRSPAGGERRATEAAAAEASAV